MKLGAWSIGIAGALVALGAAGQEADLAALKAAAKANAKEATAALAYGRALRRAGHFADAATELQRGATLGTALKGGLAGQIGYELARVRIDQRDASGARRACDGLGKDTPISNACRADAFLLENRATEALPLAQKALGAESTLYEAKVAEGRAFAMQGKITEAEASYRAAIGTNDGRPEAHRYLGLLLANQSKKDAALIELKKAASNDASDADIQVDLATTHGATKEGKDALVKAVTIRPSFAAAQAELARVSLELGDVSGADTAAAEAVKLDATMFAGHIALARVRVAQSKWDEALKEGEAAKKILANSAQPELVIADAHAGKGDIDLAIASYQSAFGLDHSDPAPLVRAARACVVAGRPTTARGFADKATSEFPKWAPAWVALGEVAEKQGDKAKAKSAYEAALKADGPLDKDAVKKKIDTLR